MSQAGHPVVWLHMRDVYDLGSELFRWEMATAIASRSLQINPFDQPDVESAKVLARQMVAAYKSEGQLPALTPALSSDGITVYGEVTANSPAEALKRFASLAQPGDYVAIQAYVQPTAAITEALQQMRLALRNELHVATTVGFGPRFLHSTGQLHKGDRGNGLFIQITADNARDADIPDEAGAPDSSMTFGVLEAAQSMGDRQALLDNQRRIIRFHLPADVIAGLQQLQG
ncbi:MAG: hypothetical protein HC837_04155 [Chloroflexaceae bacterium]|nr:hypothetical protein [Chloroflexaceae bacterium]